MSFSHNKLRGFMDTVYPASPSLISSSASYSVLYNGSNDANTPVLTNSSYSVVYSQPVGANPPTPKQYLQLADTKFLLLGLLGLLVARTIWIVIYRIWFHPLAKYPGPKMIAATKFVEMYYDLMDKKGFAPYIERLHEQYGPIVRSGPDEVSINDKDFQLDFFQNDHNQVKDPWFYNFGFLNALALTTNKAKHLERKKHILHLLSTSGFYFKGFYSMFEERISNFGQVLEDTFEKDGALNISSAYRKMTNAVLREILLGDTAWSSTDFDDGDEFVYHPLFQSMSVLRHFKFLQKVYDVIGIFIQRWVPMARYTRDAEVNILGLAKKYEAMSDDQKTTMSGDQKPLLYELIDGSRLYAENDYRAAIEEFLELFWGGREAIGGLLTTITYYLLNQPETAAKLRAELRSTRLDLSVANFSQLQRLPYLNACCKEGLRLTAGNYLRMPRVSSVPTRYGQEIIPAGMSISYQTAFNHHNPDIYDEPRAFMPERWLHTDRLAEQEHYFRPWGHGQRACAGRAVAYEIIWRSVANVFSKYQLEWRDVSAEQVWEAGALKVFPAPGTVGVTVGVKKYDS